MVSLKSYFLLDPTVIYLNHGTAGATPRPVFDTYQDWQRKLEFEPVQFGRLLGPGFIAARTALGSTINADPDDVVFVVNATMGVNIVSRSLKLNPGDEILTCDHEYGSCNWAWEYACLKTGAKYVYTPISLPVSSPQQVLEEFWQGVTPRTRVIYLSHVTSPTALIIPIELIIQRARQNGIITVIDGAHAPGQVKLDMQALGVDFYVGNCHKWMMSPKGTGFLYARRERQELLDPLIVSWGYRPDRVMPDNGSYFVSMYQSIGTKDYASHMSVPAAIDFMREHNWDTVTQDCHLLLKDTLHRIQDITGLAPIYPDDMGFYSQMGFAPLPASMFAEGRNLYRHLFDDYHIEIPPIRWKDHYGYRISVQGYNTQEDMDTLVKATKALL